MMFVKFISKEKQNRKYENVVAKHMCKQRCNHNGASNTEK